MIITMSTRDEHECELAEDNIPLQQRRPFGSGLKRKHIAFVPASNGPLASTDTVSSTKPARSIADMYLSLVLPSHGTTEKDKADEPETSENPEAVCEVCNLPIPGDGPTTARRHEASIAHQVCLTHSHPPSALDRSRMGLQILQNQGWDPDARAGLGAQGQGLHYPIKAAPKDDRLGIGVKIPKDLPKKKEKATKLDAGKVRKAVADEKKRNDRLRQQLFSSSEVDKYLGC